MMAEWFGCLTPDPRIIALLPVCVGMSQMRENDEISMCFNLNCHYPSRSAKRRLKMMNAWNQGPVTIDKLGRACQKVRISRYYQM